MRSLAIRSRLLLALGWVALFTMVATRVVNNARAHRDIAARLPAGSVYLREDFDGPVSELTWRAPGVRTLMLNCFYPSPPLVRDGVLLLAVRAQPSLCGGRLRPLRADGLSSRQRFPLPFRLAARLRASPAPGAITALFSYSDPLEGTPHHENDIEFPGAWDHRQVFWLNQFAPWLPPRNGGYQIERLAFDAARDFHVYAIDVYADRTEWRVDGALVHSVENSATAAAQGAHVNTWFSPRWRDVYENARFNDTGPPAAVDWIEVRALEGPP